MAAECQTSLLHCSAHYKKSKLDIQVKLTTQKHPLEREKEHISMVALPCQAFIPMRVHGEYYCFQCGLNFDYHQEHQGMIFLPNATNQQQLQPQQQLVLGNGVIPHNWHDLPMVHMLHAALGYEEPPAIRSWVFTEYQIRHMWAMARWLQWSLRGRFRDPQLHQFCADIGISWTQFSNWVHRNHERFAGNY